MQASISDAQWPPAPGQRVELPKAFEPLTAEERIYNWWESCGYFKPAESASKAPFTMPMPPPNVTGKLHMGHAMFVTVQDAMARHARMTGRPTLWLPGTDHAGIATQVRAVPAHHSYHEVIGSRRAVTAALHGL